MNPIFAGGFSSKFPYRRKKKTVQVSQTMTPLHNLLIGRKTTGKPSSYHQFFYGSKLRTDKDKDGIPFGMDCNDNDPRKDAPIIPQSLQSPVLAQTVAQVQESKIGVPTQQVQLSEVSRDQYITEQKKLFEEEYKKVSQELTEIETNKNKRGYSTASEDSRINYLSGKQSGLGSLRKYLDKGIDAKQLISYAGEYGSAKESRVSQMRLDLNQLAQELGQSYVDVRNKYESGKLSVVEAQSLTPQLRQRLGIEIIEPKPQTINTQTTSTKNDTGGSYSEVSRNSRISIGLGSSSTGESQPRNFWGRIADTFAGNRQESYEKTISKEGLVQASPTLSGRGTMMTVSSDAVTNSGIFNAALATTDSKNVERVSSTVAPTPRGQSVSMTGQSTGTNWTKIFQETGLDTFGIIYSAGKNAVVNWDKRLGATREVKDTYGKFSNSLSPLLTGFRETVNPKIEEAKQFTINFIPEIGKSFEQRRIDEEIAQLEAIAKADPNSPVASRLNFLYQSQYQLEKQRRNEPIMMLSSAGRAAVGTPFDIASQGISLATSPISTAKVFISDIKGIPSALAYSPLSTIGSLVGTTVASELLFSGLGKFTNLLGEETALTRVKTQAVSKDISFGDAMKVGTNPDGSYNWVVKGKVKTNIVDVKTGEILRRLNTESSSLVVTSTDKAGAIKAASNSLAATLGERGVKTFRDDAGIVVKITKKFDVSSGIGSYTFVPDKNAQNIFRGTGSSTIYQEGIAKLRATKGLEGTDIVNVEGRFIKSRATPKSTAQSNIISQIINQREVYRDFGLIKATGTETTARSLIRTDIYPELVKVKGYGRTAKGNTLDFGFFRKITEESKRVNPYTRRPRSNLLGSREKTPFRSTQIDFSRSFVPKEKKLDVSSVDLTSPLNQVDLTTISTQKQGAVASTTAQTQLKSIFQSIGKDVKITREIKTTSPTFTKAASVVKQTGRFEPVFVSGALVQDNRQVEKTKTNYKSSEAVIAPSSLASSTKTTTEERTGLFTSNTLSGGLIVGPRTGERQQDKEGIALVQPSRLNSGQLTRLSQQPVQTFVGVPFINVPQTPTPNERVPPTKTPRTFLFPEEEKKKIGSKQGFNVAVYRDATKGSKARWEQLNKKPITRNTALDLGSRETDGSISARFKVSKSSSKDRPVDSGDGYWQRFGYKFRNFVQKAGRRTSSNGVYIEKARYRSDSIGEQTTLRSARASSLLMGGMKSSKRNGFRL